MNAITCINPVGLAPRIGTVDGKVPCCFCYKARSLNGLDYTVRVSRSSGSHRAIACGFDSLDDMLGWIGRENTTARRLPDGTVAYTTRKMRGGNDGTGFTKAKCLLGYVWEWSNDNEVIAEEIWLKRNGYEI